MASSGAVQLPVLDHTELLAFVASLDVWGRGLSPSDAHLLGSVVLHGSAMLWTRDERLLPGAEDLGVEHDT